MDRAEYSSRRGTNEDRVRTFLENMFSKPTGSSHLTNSYVSRANPRDNTRHVILSTASMRPMDFAAQLNVSLANGWGIVRTVADLCLKMPEGKYVLVKDPNKVGVYPCFVVCVAVLAHFKGTANFWADPMPSTIYGLLFVHSVAHGLFFYSRLFGCMLCLSRHSPAKKRMKKARLPR
jgi:Eukaryotic translation initiation factor 3 subunit 7 (eIF-3)